MTVVLVFLVQFAALFAAEVLGLTDEVGPWRVWVATSVTMSAGLLIGRSL